MGPYPLRDVHPTACNTRFPETVAGPRARDDLAVSRGAPLPRHPEMGALGRVRHDRGGGRQWLALDARAARVRGWRLLHGRSARKLTDHRAVTVMWLAQPRGFTRAGAGVTTTMK
jgi:hypothetical protein